MPTYSYACTACEHRFDTKQSFTDASLTDCPECTGRLRKLFSPVGVVFKGSGFYRTDSRSKPPSESGAADKPDKSKSDTKPETKSGTNSDAKSGSGSSGSSSTSSGAGGSSGTSGSSSAKSSSTSASTS